MYYDLNVPWNEESQQRIPQLIKLYQKCTHYIIWYLFLITFLVGYGAIAFNHTVTAKLPKNVNTIVPYDLILIFIVEVSNKKG